MTRIMHHSLAAILAIVITATTFTEVVSIPTDRDAPAAAAQVA